MFREIAILRSGLHDHLVGFAETNESGLIVRTHQYRQVIQRLAGFDTLLQRLVIIHVQHVLRIACRIEGERIANLRPLIHFRYERLAHTLHFVVIVVAGLVQQTQFESTGRTVAGHRGRFEEVDVGLCDAFALLFQVFDNLLRRAFSVLPILQIDQATARVGARSLREDFEPGQGRHAFDAFFLFCDFEQLLCDLVRALNGGPRRRFDHRIDHALVLLRNEARRESHVDPIGQTAEE